MFKRKEKTGAITYKRGKRGRKEYKSKCLGYRFVYPKEGELADEKTLISRDTDNCVTDMQFYLLSGVYCGVQYVVQDGTLSEDTDWDMLGRAMVQKMNENATDGRTAIYHGIEEFLGKPCIHHSVTCNVNGNLWVHEFYGYNTPYYSIQYCFTSFNHHEEEVEMLKQAFRKY